MRPFAPLSVALTVAIASGCTAGDTQSLAGRSYQVTDESSDFRDRIGIEFVDDSQFVLKIADQELVKFSGQYTVTGAQSETIEIQIDDPDLAAMSSFVQMERQGSAIDLAIDELAVTLEPVDELLLTDEPFDNSANESQANAKTYINSINRGQQIYFLENQQFATAMDDLGLGIPTETEQYVLQMQSRRDLTVSLATAKAAAMNSYLGVAIADETTTKSILCELPSDAEPVPELSSIFDTAASRALKCPLGNEM
ncbi:MAG: type IV pilin-like G/H family protein [Leptolyngbyaceae cyanobacterium]